MGYCMCIAVQQLKERTEVLQIWNYEGSLVFSIGEVFFSFFFFLSLVW